MKDVFRDIYKKLGLRMVLGILSLSFCGIFEGFIFLSVYPIIYVAMQHSSNSNVTSPCSGQVNLASSLEVMAQ